MKRMLLVGAALLIGASAVIAQSDPIAERRTIMKGVGAATRTGTQMVRGETAFDAAKAKEILRVYAAAADKTHTYFPETSKTGGETTASPKIWESQAEFRKRFDDWAKEIKAASAQTDTLDEFKVAFGNLTKACGACHQTYRISKS
ncbi:c-type cytochrome [Salinarimonas soli]|uniref:Cytochrome c n=1 Tax=Salinarimonas soli TaxID=1638099 RepID=A0A5B2V859_9HYPH|nr:cytochrome c [Salinarimonas soli]KAA2234387.1 cytochrome c [Salinarimonas soli]